MTPSGLLDAEFGTGNTTAAGNEWSNWGEAGAGDASTQGFGRSNTEPSLNAGGWTAFDQQN